MIKLHDLNNYLNKFSWGCVTYNNGFNITDGNNIDDWIQYKILSPKKFILAHCGCCWDYTNFEYYFFKKYYSDINIKCYYIEYNNGATHTWLSYFKNNKVYTFESSLKQHTGITEFQYEEESLLYYKQIVIPTVKDYVIYEYIPIINVNALEFMAYIFKTGKLIKNIGDYYNKYIKHVIESNYKDFNSYEW